MILLALYHRERSGEGSAIEIPMFENLAKFVLEEHMYLKTFDPPLGPVADPRLMDPNAKPLPTKDSWICISANTNAQAFAIFEAIGRPELKDDPRFSSVAARFKNVHDYFAIRAEGLKQRPPPNGSRSSTSWMCRRCRITRWTRCWKTRISLMWAFSKRWIIRPRARFVICGYRTRRRSPR
jgi:hypothetical protein